MKHTATVQHSSTEDLSFLSLIDQLGYTSSHQVGYVANTQKPNLIEFCKHNPNSSVICNTPLRFIVDHSADDFVLDIHWNRSKSLAEISNVRIHTAKNTGRPEANNTLNRTGKALEVVEKIFGTFLKNNAEDDDCITVRSWSWNPTVGRPIDRWMTLENKAQDSIYDSLYPDINIQTLSEYYKESSASILLVTGEPGTGKTTLARYIALTSNYDEVSFVKDRKVIEDTSFWSDMIENSNSLVILDDITCSIETEGRADPFLENLLSYSSSIFNKAPKVIITTNIDLQSVDSALTRPGRCFESLRLYSLSHTEALTLWTDFLKQPENVFTQQFPVPGPVSQASLMSLYEEYTSGNHRDKYIKNDRCIDRMSRAHIGI